MKKTNFGKLILTCQMCKSRNINLVLDLGFHPPSDAFLPEEEMLLEETLFPLRLVSCSECGLLQIDYLVNPEILYGKNYLYQTSVTDSGREYYLNFAKQICLKFLELKDGLVVDIGSNVGVLLEGFKNLGFKVVGVDPAPISRMAQKVGIYTINDFFNDKAVMKINSKYGKASVITATNVFAHLHERDSVVKNIKNLLDNKGIFVIEAPYALDMIRNTEYDTIYLEHLSYLSVKPMEKYFKKFGLELFNIEKTSIHGGSLRYFVGHTGKHKISQDIYDYIIREEEFGLYSMERLLTFSNTVEKRKCELVELLINLKNKKKKIVGLSAPAKSTTLLNYCKIDRSLIAYVTEKNPLKIGRFTPGMHIPIYGDQKIIDDQPDYALLLAWNFADNIMKNMSAFKKAGGKFVLPVPKVRLI